MYIRIVSALGAAAATAATLAFATPASAQTDTRSTRVSIAGLDLSKPADGVRLERRIRAAAREVCGPDERDVSLRADQLACERKAAARANADARLALRGGGSSAVALTAE